MPDRDLQRNDQRLVDVTNLSGEDKALALHQLKSQINQILLDANGEPTLKDSLEIAEKINDYYLREYRPQVPKTFIVSNTNNE